MKKLFLTFVIGAGIMAVLVFWLTKSLTTTLQEERKPYQDKIGETVIIGNDTLTVLDYSTVLQNFTLSNGKTVDASLILNNNQ